MKKADLKELIKQSMLEVSPKGDSGAMTREEEEMAADIEVGADKYTGEKDLAQASMMLDDFESKLKSHDWHYMMSDDSRAYSNGSSELKKLKELAKELADMGYKVDAAELYDKYNRFESITFDKFIAPSTPFIPKYKRKQMGLDEGEPLEEVIKRTDMIIESYSKKKTLNEEMHGGYLELFEMNPDFEEGVAKLLQAWEEWKEGPETEPEMIEEAKHDILAYLSSMIK